jgi:hypothetical protein
MSSYFAGLTTSIVTLPIWTLRTRISLITLDKNDSRSFRNRLEFFVLTIKESVLKEGVFKLYKGLFSSVVLSLHGGIQMTIYETGKQSLVQRQGEIKNKQGSFLGVFSKVTASCVLYPFNVIRARQQQFSCKISNLDENLKKHVIITDKNYGLFFNSIKVIHSSNGFKGFYQGIIPTILRQLPGSSTFFYTYEYILKLFK